MTAIKRVKINYLTALMDLNHYFYCSEAINTILYIPEHCKVISVASNGLVGNDRMQFISRNPLLEDAMYK